ncbi:hypothetical protein PQX77_015557 [Marasmius sp. AFHP31]|nr:hypothetical protein PQX77_015557 [Marasmius sp. AFHP31]
MGEGVPIKLMREIRLPFVTFYPDNITAHTLQRLPGLTNLEIVNHTFHEEMWDETPPYCNVVGEKTLLALTNPASSALQVIRLADCPPAYAPLVLDLARLRRDSGQLKTFFVQFGDCSQAKLNEFIRAEETLAEVGESRRGEMVLERKWDDRRIALRDHDDALDGFCRFDDHLDSIFPRYYMDSD